MTEPGCADMGLLIQADMDGELSAAEAARVAAHLEHCAACASLLARMLDMSTSVRRDLPRYTTPMRLRWDLKQRIADANNNTAAEKIPARKPRMAFGAGFALAACLALAVMQSRGPAPSMQESMATDIVSAHIRALQPGHLLDVASTDQHTVKPWFDGRLPFAPPVKDLASTGFPLTGGRLDFVGGHSAAALIYRRDKHIIDVFAWPGTGLPESGNWHGYNYVAWQQGGMALWAVSDLNMRELNELVDSIVKSSAAKSQAR